MQLDEAKEKFIQAWGALGSNWGINRTMAQVHALLLISPESLSADEIMEALNISRGNANMNLRALIDWGLVNKEHKAGERKEYFYAEKDIWQVAKQVIMERRKRELKPVLKVLKDVKKVETDEQDPHARAFVESVENLEKIVSQADKLLELFIQTDQNWLLNAILKLANTSKK
ncbi:MAG: ArsR family transcriptional regulator [Bacteroidetes bacterium]|nr:MAG: ArsR family transcriptional regulator [Bacteroidota bacterium]